jgi:hypothetical protein
MIHNSLINNQSIKIDAYEPVRLRRRENYFKGYVRIEHHRGETIEVAAKITLTLFNQQNQNCYANVVLSLSKDIQRIQNSFSSTSMFARTFQIIGNYDYRRREL